MRNVVLLLCCVPGLALAQIDELENPGTVTAVQDRQFRMNHELAFGVGVLPLDAFYKGLTAHVGYTNHFSDHFAWQVARGSYSYNVNTALRNQLERDFGVLPTAFDQVNWAIGSDFIWSPLYGKLAYLNRSVLHFEVSLIAGASLLRVTLGTGGNAGGGGGGTSTSAAGLAANFKPAANLGLSMRLFVNKAISWRLDVTDNVVLNDRIPNVPTIELSAAINFGGTE